MAESCDLLCLDLPKAEAIRAEQLEPEAAERAVVAAQALGDPTRLNVAAALAQTDELCGCDLSWITGRSQKLVSHHLKVLRQAGLAESRRDGRIVYFSLSPAGRALLEAVLAPKGARA
jgi:ArsR family transcriptional regulator, lead/cadmium/zinc/bismuth-responsive transcriptional repressor